MQAVGPICHSSQTECADENNDENGVHMCEFMLRAQS